MEEKLDIRERGGPRNGQPQFSDRRLFMQLLAFGDCEDSRPLVRALDMLPGGVLYADVNDPHGMALLSWSEDPEYFVNELRQFLLKPPFAALTPKLEYTMLGRTYALGHEPNLDDWLLEQPRRRVTDGQYPWAVWYPLRRAGAFSALPAEEQVPILREHGRIGHQFGEAGFAQDVRLASFGLDKNDNDFVIGLIGRKLYPLSACVQAMRKTRQTSQYIEKMGPFFVGKVIWSRNGNSGAEAKREEDSTNPQR
jgi:chlorite dismutase